MTYQGIELTHSYGDSLSGWNKNSNPEDSLQSTVRFSR